jgi:hypothetical protein
MLNNCHDDNTDIIIILLENTVHAETLALLTKPLYFPISQTYTVYVRYVIIRNISFNLR